MNYWLMKSEPSAYSWQQLVKDKRTNWSGVRNYTARNNMQAMQVGDRAFFYHSNEGMEIVGLMEIVREAYADPTDATGKFVQVDVKPLQSAATPLTLHEIKADKMLQNMQLVKQSRLSVSAVTEKEYILICQRCGFRN